MDLSKVSDTGINGLNATYKMSCNQYVVFEGVDGVGKTTLAKNFAEYLGFAFEEEPNQSWPLCKLLRKVALGEEFKDALNSREREVLLNVARSHFVRNGLKPMLEGGYGIVVDRSFISGIVYSGSGDSSGGIEAWMMEYGGYLPYPSLVVYVDADEQKLKNDSDEFYDKDGEEEHNLRRKHFANVLKYVSDLKAYSSEKEVRVVCFKMDWNSTPEQNLDRLIKGLAVPGRRAYSKIEIIGSEL